MHFSNMVQLTQNRSKIVTFQHLNIKNRYFSFFFQTKSSKSVVYFMLRAYFNSDIKFPLEKDVQLFRFH